MDERVRAALRRHHDLELLHGRATLPVAVAREDAAVLAREVQRLRRLLDARPPYRMSDGWTPAEMAALLHRDNEILKAVDAREGDAS